MRNGAKISIFFRAQFAMVLCLAGLVSPSRGLAVPRDHTPDVTFTAGETGDPETIVRNSPQFQAFSTMRAILEREIPQQTDRSDKFPRILNALLSSVTLGGQLNAEQFKEALAAERISGTAQTELVTAATQLFSGNADLGLAQRAIQAAIGRPASGSTPAITPDLARGEGIIRTALAPRPSPAPSPGANPSASPGPNGATGQTPKPSLTPEQQQQQQRLAELERADRERKEQERKAAQAAQQAAQQAAAAQAAQQGQGGGGGGGAGGGGEGGGGKGGGGGGENGGGKLGESPKTPSFKDTHDKLNPNGNEKKGPNLSELRGLLGDDKAKEQNKKKDDFSFGGDSGRGAKDDEAKKDDKKSSLADLVKQKQEEQNAIDPTAGKIGPVKQEYNGPTSVPQVIGYYGGGSGATDPSAFSSSGGGSSAGSAMAALGSSTITGAGGAGGANQNSGGDPFGSIGKTKFTPPEPGLKRIALEFGGEDAGFESGGSEGDNETTRKKDPKGTALINELVFSDNLEEIRGRGIFGLASRLPKWCRGVEGKVIGVCQKAYASQQVLSVTNNRSPEVKIDVKKSLPALTKQLEVNKAILLKP